MIARLKSNHNNLTTKFPNKVVGDLNFSIYFHKKFYSQLAFLKITFAHLSERKLKDRVLRMINSLISQFLKQK